MAKNQGPWGNNDNANPWGDNEETLNSPKVVDFSVLERIKKDDGFDFKIRWALLALLVIWLLSGFYQIQPSEQGVVLRFGAYAYTTDAGLHYHLPYPIESVEKVSITQERSITIGEAAYSSGSNSFTESHMLTGDENIVDINLTVVWRIKNAKDYLFNMRSPDITVQVAAQSVLREIVGQSEMQPIITGDRGKVEDETKAELQKVLDEFGSGIEIVRVKLQKADMSARAALIKAERDLVAWALSIVPAGVRSTLAPAAEKDHATRKKIIDLAMRLDASTISSRVV